MRKNIASQPVLEALVMRIGSARPECRRQWGTMNVQQMLVHLGDGSAAALGQRTFAARPRPGGTVIRFVALYLLPRTPRGIKSGAEPAAKTVEPSAFATDRERAIGLLRQLAAPGQQLAAAHPIFGKMSRGDWMRYAYLHVDHHLRQFGL